MRVNFGSLGGDNSPDTVTSPRDIFSLLTSKASKYQYLRDVQAEVLTQWFERRNENHLVLKMNTGSGKTVVGLLALKSGLNEGFRPAVYVAPSPYLVKQVVEEAEALGIEVTSDVNSPRFIRGKAILVATVSKLINGKSVFGVGQEGIKIPIGSIVIDDAHACLTISEDQFSVLIPATHDAYKRLFSLFESDIEHQSPNAMLDIKAGDPVKYALVPYWAWIDKQKEVLSVLHQYRGDDFAKFSLPLLSEHLNLCGCVIGGEGIEITPHCLPISVIPSFGTARRHIYMTAAFADDNVLVSDFDALPESIDRPITPSSAGDIGDRMILVPQELNPDVTDQQLKCYFKELSKKHNVIVLVPSNYRAKFWADVADRILDASTLANGVEELKHGHVGLVVLANKYDGIDLPNSACRVLVIDGLPDVLKKIDRIEQAILHDSDLIISQAIQRIEQGMGRGIRSNEDYCAVFLMGASLIRMLYANRAIEKFTPATRAQVTLSDRLAAQIEGGTVEEIGEVVDRFLARDRQWVTASRSATVQTRYESGGPKNRIPIQQRTAFNAAAKRDYPAAISELQQAINEAGELTVKGWLLQHLAEYTHPLNPAETQVIQRAALEKNSRVLRPLGGIAYTRMPSAQSDQATQCISYLREHFPQSNNLIITANAYLDALVFRPDTASQFERAMASVAFVLGFQSQQPESEIGRGPDVLWSLGELFFLVIECKNGATTPTVNKHDANQLTGSMNWFWEKYDKTCTATPILVHPSRLFERAGTPHPYVRVINSETLPMFAEAIRRFVNGVAQLSNYGTPKEVAALLDALSLTSPKLINAFSTDYRMKS